jgi:hypothetical protein
LSFCISVVGAAQPDKSAPINRATQPIKDEAGRVEIIVDFDFDPETDLEFDDVISPSDERKWNGHNAKVIKFLNHYEKKYDLTRNGMMSSVKVSLTGFATELQIGKLAKDKRVLLITENEPQGYSAFYVAPNNDVGGEYYSYGWNVTTKNIPRIAPATSKRRVYVVDSGVAMHDDLNVISRVNMACGTTTINCSDGSATDEHPAVGCYPHSTHVAGIVGAIGNNAKTSIGVYAGVKLISVAVNKAPTAINDPLNVYRGKCAGNLISTQASSTTQATVASVGYALEYVYRNTLDSYIRVGDNAVPIVNMSINSGKVGFDSAGIAETNRAALLKLVTPALNVCASPPGIKTCMKVNYTGAFFVQSAGNIGAQTGGDGVVGANGQTRGDYVKNGKDLCSKFEFKPNANIGAASSLAYKSSSASTQADVADGIMVVGGIHAGGMAASSDLKPLPVPAGDPLDYRFNGSYNSTGQSLGPATLWSNYGPCVDVWAPGNGIYSTWGDHVAANNLNAVVGVTYSGGSVTGTSGWTFLSGTSMAAPFVAGAAAYLADIYNLTTPAAIEAKVRQFAVGTSYSDQSGTAIKIVQLP